MFKLSIQERSKAEYPADAFQVSLNAQGDGQKPRPFVEAVTLTRYSSAYDRLYFTRPDGSESHCNSLNFFESEADAQKHIEFAYNWKPKIEEVHA